MKKQKKKPNDQNTSFQTSKWSTLMLDIAKQPNRILENKALSGMGLCYSIEVRINIVMKLMEGITQEKNSIISIWIKCLM